MEGTPSNESFGRGCHDRTRILSHTYTFKWTIENCSRLVTGSQILSSSFYPVPLIESYVKFIVKEKTLDFTLYYRGERRTEVSLDFILTDYSGREIQRRSMTANTLQVVHLADVDRTNLEPLERDLVTATIRMVYKQNDYTSRAYRHTERLGNERDQMELLKKVFVSPPCDSRHPIPDVVTLSRVGDTTTDIPLDGMLLYRASPVFAKMLERSSERIEIYDLDLDAVQNLISFLYTGAVADDDPAAVRSLYDAALKYEMPHLRDRCRDLIRAQLSPENALDILLFSERHKDDILKESALAVIITYRELSFATKNWFELVRENTALARAVIGKYVRAWNADPHAVRTLPDELCTSEGRAEESDS